MKSVAIHAVLALAGLGLAYQTWTREPDEQERPDSEVTVLNCAEGEFEAINLETPTHTFVVEPQKRGDDTLYWITSQRKPPKKKEAEPTSQPTAQPAKPVDLPKPKRFLASSKFTDFLGSITPLRAVQSLGEIPEADFEKFGFDEVGTHFSLSCGGKKVELDVGGRTYGTGKRYVRQPSTKVAYVVEGKLIQDLQSAQYKFMQVALHDFEFADVDEAKVEGQGGSRRLLHRNHKVKAQARWVDASEPDRRNELFGNWFDRLKKLKVQDYLPDAAAPGSDLEAPSQVPATPVVKIEYSLEGESKGSFELVRVDGADKPVYYVKTETTRNWTRVYDSVAKQIDTDVPMVVGVEVPAEEVSSPPDTPAEPAPVDKAAPTPPK